MLAAAPVPPFPDSLEQQVLGALSLESVSRMRQPVPHPTPVGQRRRHRVRPARGPQAAPALPSRRPSSRAGGRRLAATGPRALGISQILLPAVAGLLVLGAGAGYLIDTWPETPAAQEHGAARTVAFLVRDSGTSFRKATLRVQIQDMLAARATVPTVRPAGQPGLPSWATTSPAAGPAVRRSGAHEPAGLLPTGGVVAPSPALVGCVMHLTGNVSPVFVDRATYQSQPAYVIAVSSRAWVVGVDCTAADPRLITSVQLSTPS
jgi:hypothetical protein